MFEEAVAAFLADASVRCTRSTVTFYEKRLVFLLRKFTGRQLSELTRAEILSVLDAAGKWPDGRLKAPDTIRSNVITWEQLQKWAIEQEYLENPITKKIPKPMGRKRELIPSIDDTKAIMELCRPDFVPIFRALRLTGARPGELCKAEIKHIDAEAGEIVLTEHKTARKTGRPRRIAVGHPALIEIVREAIGDRTEGFIFMRASNKPWTTIAIGAAYREARLKAGLPKGLVPYLCRHEHATELYKTTGDLKSVADALGHAQLSTTMRYTRIDGDRLKSNQKLFKEGLGTEAAPESPPECTGIA